MTTIIEKWNTLGKHNNNNKESGDTLGECGNDYNTLSKYENYNKENKTPLGEDDNENKEKD